MTTIYAVSAGSYSDYRVVALFSTPELAQEFMDVIRDGDYNDIEEYELDNPAAEKVRAGLRVWSVFMLHDGTIECCKVTDTNRYNVENVGEWLWERTKAPAYQGRGIPDVLRVTAWAKDAKHAIKIANEKRLQRIASGWKP